LGEQQQQREEEIEDLKLFVSAVGACTELIQFQCLAGKAADIREKLERLLPPMTNVEQQNNEKQYDAGP